MTYPQAYARAAAQIACAMSLLLAGCSSSKGVADARLNPQLTTAAREDALQQVRDLGIPALLSANRRFHQLLVTGVPVEVQRGGETLGERLAEIAGGAGNKDGLGFVQGGLSHDGRSSAAVQGGLRAALPRFVCPYSSGVWSHSVEPKEVADKIRDILIIAKPHDRLKEASFRTRPDPKKYFSGWRAARSAV